MTKDEKRLLVNLLDAVNIHDTALRRQRSAGGRVTVALVEGSQNIKAQVKTLLDRTK